MRSPSVQRTYLLCIGLFVAATTILVVQLTGSLSVVVTSGESSAGLDVARTGFDARDVAVTAIAGCVFGASGVYLFLGEPAPAGPDRTGAASRQTSAPRSDFEETDELLNGRRQVWEETAERLANNERTVYETVLDADGEVAQSDIVERTDLSKATVSRTLDRLEAKDLVERKRRGVGNVVVLQ